jgi:hypothetical protein
MRALELSYRSGVWGIAVEFKVCDAYC